MTETASPGNWADIMEDEEDQDEVQDNVAVTNNEGNAFEKNSADEQEQDHKGSYKSGSGRNPQKKNVYEELENRPPGRVTLYLNKAHPDATEDDVLRLDKHSLIEKVSMFKKGSFTLEFLKRDDALYFLESASKKIFGRSYMIMLPHKKREEDFQYKEDRQKDEPEKKKYETKPKYKPGPSNRKESYDWDGDYDYDSKNHYSYKKRGDDYEYYDENYDNNYHYDYNYKEGDGDYHQSNNSHYSRGKGSGSKRGGRNGHRGNQGGGYYSGGGGYGGGSRPHGRGNKNYEYAEKKPVNNGGDHQASHSHNVKSAQQQPASNEPPAQSFNGVDPSNGKATGPINFYRHEGRGPIEGEEQKGGDSQGPRRPIGFVNKKKTGDAPEKTNNNIPQTSSQQSQLKSEEKPKTSSSTSTIPQRKGSTKNTNRFESLDSN